jgi:hypothetical protein
MSPHSATRGRCGETGLMCVRFISVRIKTEAHTEKQGMFLPIQTEVAKDSLTGSQRQTTYQDMSPHLASRAPFEAPHVERLRFFSLKIKKKKEHVVEEKWRGCSHSPVGGRASSASIKARSQGPSRREEYEHGFDAIEIRGVARRGQMLRAC